MRRGQLLAQNCDVAAKPCEFSKDHAVVISFRVGDTFLIGLDFSKVFLKLGWAVEAAGSNIRHLFLQTFDCLRTLIRPKRCDPGRVRPKMCSLSQFPSGLTETLMLDCPAEGRSMAYEWDAGRARRARMIKFGSMLALAASALSVPVALLLTASPF